MADPFVKDADFNPRTDVLTVIQRQYIGDIIAENLKIQKIGNNGFTPDRTMRLEGRIPVMEYYGRGLHKMEPAERHFAIVRLLNDHPEYRTVERLRTQTANETSVIVK